MKRRDFVRRALQLSAAGLIVPSFLRRGTILDPSLARAATGDALAGRILVLVNLNGGNDGINTVPPYTDPTYFAVRPTLAIPPDQVIPIGAATGLHPSLAALAPLYTAGRMAIVQGVGYPDMNLSHFRGTDIWFSGSSAHDIVETGWLARYLEAMFPEFPALPPEKPLGLQQSLGHRIPLTGARGVTGVVVDDPSTFYYLVNQNYTGEWSDALPDTRGGEELGYARTIDQQTFAYAGVIQDASDAGTNTVAYPQTNLGLQLEIVARLISGGLGTPLYITAEYGFDTHAAQASQHATLLASLGPSLSAFLADLANQGLDEKVVIMTVSEFGRRVNENGGFGTDHGTSAPILVLGKDVNGGIYGTNPSLVDLDANGNLLIQHDYRSVYQTILLHHYGASPGVAESVLLGNFGTIPFLHPVTNAPEPDERSDDRLRGISPNPISASRFAEAPVEFDLARPGIVTIAVHDMQGRLVREVGRSHFAAGRHVLPWRLEGVPAGTYVLRMSTRESDRMAKAVVLP